MSDTDLATRLQAALGDAYHIERELPGGGMSRLFVGTERSLNRRVVIKVLPPELASDVSAARFKQEMEIAARLQHPHVLPILAAGANDDLLYYVMPYVTGESLRDYLSANGALPVRTAVSVLRDVADALAAAHRAGILHRDIKPENILLEEGHAVLTDFGIARAVEQSRAPELTGTGLAVGTPAYMAPEQLAAEPDIDGRADIYSLALVGFEMLTGKLPFGDTPGRASLAAQLTQQPPRVDTRRADVPQSVTDAIARALAKDPRERFATAQDFRDALDEAALTTTVTRAVPRSRAGRRSTIAVVATVVVAAALAAFAAHRSHRPPVLDVNAVAIAPFDVLDPSLALWREGMVDVLSRNLDGAGPLRTIPPTVIVRQWSGRADPVSAQRLGERTGARYAVFGSLIQTGGDSVRAAVSLVDASNGNVIGDVERRDVRDRMDRLSDSLTVALMRELGRARNLGPLRLSSVGTRSLPALKAFLHGQQSLRRSAFDSAATFFGQAISFDSSFALAYHGLAQAVGWTASGDDRIAMAQARAAHFNHGLAPRDSILITADSLWITLGRGPAAPPGTERRLFTALGEGTHRYPDDPEMWYALGDALFHFGGQSGQPLTAAQVLAHFDRAIALDSAYTPAYIHAINLAFRLGGAPMGRRYAEAYLSRDPTDESAEGIRLADALAGPAARTDSVQRMLDSASADALYWGATTLSGWPDTAESAVRLVRLMRGRRAVVANLGDTLFQRHMLAGLLAQRGHARESFALWRYTPDLVALGESGALPADTVNAVCLPHGRPAVLPNCISAWGPWAAFHRDTQTIEAGVRMVDNVHQAYAEKLPPSLARYLQDYLRAFLPLARGDTAGTLAALAALPDSLCTACADLSGPARGVLLERGRQYAAAKPFLDQWRPMPGFVSAFMDLELARVNERLGQRQQAIDGYSRVAANWVHADPSLQPYVTEARQALERLRTDRGPRVPIAGAAQR